MKKPESLSFARVLGAAMLGGALLFVTEPTVALNPPGGGAGPMAPVGNPPAGSDESDEQRSRDRDLDQLNEMMMPACSQQSNPCSGDFDEGEPSGSIVAPPTGSEGASSVLPIIPNMNVNRNDQAGGMDAGEDSSDFPAAGEAGNSCIGYECSQDIDASTDGDSPETESRDATASTTRPNSVDRGGSAPGDVTGYFNSDYTGRSDVPPKSPNAGNADSSATQTIADDRGGNIPDEATGYFNADYTGRSDVPPKTPKNDGGDREAPVNGTLVPVAIEPTGGGDPAPTSQACANEFGQTTLGPQANTCVNMPLVDHPSAEPPQADEQPDE